MAEKKWSDILQVFIWMQASSKQEAGQVPGRVKDEGEIRRVITRQGEKSAFHLILGMTRIGLLSDTHGYLDENVFKHFENCDEIWHAGDFGDAVAQRIKKEKRMLGVFGNIDEQDIRSEFPEQLVFMCEEVKVLMRHIGGSPPKYNPATRRELSIHQPQLFISGHSHILKIMYDDKINCLYMNPGAAGKHGWHKVRTIIRFVIDGKEMKDCEVIELGKR